MEHAENGTKRAKLAGDERAKLSATFLNNVAVAVLGSGLIAPFFVMLCGLGNLSADQVRFFGLAAPGWVNSGCRTTFP